MEAKIKRKIRGNIILMLIAAVSIVIRLLMEYDFDNTGLLYIGVPFLISMALMWIDRENPNKSWRKAMVNHLLLALIVMLGSSVVLFEGFLCVLMFLPIYLGVILLAFIYFYLHELYAKSRGTKLFGHIIPVFLLLAALEGTHPLVSVNRDNVVTVSRIIDAGVDDIRAQINTPPELQKQRQWFLSLFPMPYKTDTVGLAEGDINTAYLRYHRWFVTNTHDGILQSQITHSTERLIVFKFIENTSYLGNYMKFQHAQIQLLPLDEGRTKVVYSISYKRLLDPAWYFQPLQRYGVAQAIEFMLTQMVTPHV